MNTIQIFDKPDGPITLSSSGPHSSLWRFHFCRRFFTHKHGSVYIGSYESKILHDHEGEFFKAHVDCEAFWYTEKKKYMIIGDKLRLKVELLYGFCEALLEQSSSYKYPLLLYCTDSALYSPIFALAFYIRCGILYLGHLNTETTSQYKKARYSTTNIAGTTSKSSSIESGKNSQKRSFQIQQEKYNALKRIKKSLEEITQQIQLLCSDMFTGYNTQVDFHPAEEISPLEYLCSKVYYGQKTVLPQADSKSQEWLQALVIYAYIIHHYWDTKTTVSSTAPILTPTTTTTTTPISAILSSTKRNISQMYQEDDEFLSEHESDSDVDQEQEQDEEKEKDKHKHKEDKFLNQNNTSNKPEFTPDTPYKPISTLEFTTLLQEFLHSIPNYKVVRNSLHVGYAMTGYPSPIPKANLPNQGPLHSYFQRLPQNVIVEKKIVISDSGAGLSSSAGGAKPYSANSNSGRHPSAASNVNDVTYKKTIQEKQKLLLGSHRSEIIDQSRMNPINRNINNLIYVDKIPQKGMLSPPPVSTVPGSISSPTSIHLNMNTSGTFDNERQVMTSAAKPPGYPVGNTSGNVVTNMYSTNSNKMTINIPNPAAVTQPPPRISINILPPQQQQQQQQKLQQQSEYSFDDIFETSHTVETTRIAPTSTITTLPTQTTMQMPGSTSIPPPISATANSTNVVLPTIDIDVPIDMTTNNQDSNDQDNQDGEDEESWWSEFL